MPPKPICVRISQLPGDVTETELEGWLSTLESSKTTRETNPCRRTQSSSEKPIQLRLAPNGRTQQATATFNTVPVVFDRTGEPVPIQNNDKSRWNDAVADTHFQGMTVAYTPPAGTVIQADIVAVSGLGGHALGSWGSPKDYRVWLRDFLPKDIEAVRVLLWGYNTSIAPGANKNWKEQLSELAKSMLDGLGRVRGAEEKQRPIIFLGHSLGGLVVEAALAFAFDHEDEDEEIKDICQSSAGVVLFGVPHEGIRFWELVDAVDGQRSQAFIANLQTDEDTESSEVLSMHVYHFARMLKKQGLPVVCYWEKDVSKIAEVFQREGRSEPRLLVTKNSAIGIGIIPKPLAALGLKGDHRSIVKFENRNDEGYQSVRHNIEKMIQQYKPRERDEERAVHPSPVQLDLAMLETLNFQEMNYREREIRDAHTDTCTWIFGHESYMKWIENDKGILGIRGKPGSGKSTLMKTIFQTLQSGKDATHIQLAFFYHRRGTAIQYSEIGMYRTLLYQLLSSIPAAGSYFQNLVEEKQKWQGIDSKNWNWRLEELQLALSDALSSASRSIKLRIFVDALDEAGKQAAQDVIKYLRAINKKLIAQNARVSICFSCRRYPVLAIQEGFEVRVEEQNQEDIRSYIYSELEELLDFDDRSENQEEILEELGSIILNRASNVFMWVTIVVEMVATGWNEGQNSSQIQHIIDTAPSDLDELYRHIITSVIDPASLSETLHLMQWIFLAERPLTSSEMYFALASDDSTDTHLQSDLTKIEARMKKRINSLSGGLAEAIVHYKKNSKRHQVIVQFIHQSVNDFLERDKFECLPIDKSEDPIGQGHDRLARTCINFVKLRRTDWKKMFEDDSESYELEPFGEYCIKYCFVHSVKAENLGISQTYLIEQFEWPSRDVLFDNLCNIYIPGYMDRFADAQPTLFHVASHWNLNSVVDELLRRGVDVEEADEKGNVAMHYASDNGSKSVVEALLAVNAPPGPSNYKGETPFSVAARKGDETIVRILFDSGADISAGNALHDAAKNCGLSVVSLLVRMGADVNSQGGKYANALQAAAFSNYDVISVDSLVGFLLEAGAHVNATGGFYGNALQAAAYRGSEEIVKLLLDAGAHVNATGGFYGNALQATAGKGPEKIVKLLLEAGASANATSGHHGNALHAAAYQGSEEKIKLLLEAGAHVNATGGYYGNALQAAAREGSEQIVKLLLEAGAHVNATGGYYGNALQAAAYKGSEETVKILLEAGASVNAPGGFYGNALQAAAFQGSEKIVKLLLEAGASVNAEGGQNNNALEAAVVEHEVAIVKLLLQAGAGINVQEGYYRSLLDEARKQGGGWRWGSEEEAEEKAEAIIQMLLEAKAKEPNRPPPSPTSSQNVEGSN